MPWVPLKGFERSYEIRSESPHEIRKIKNQKILSEYVDDSNGYVKVGLHGKNYYKHRLIAEQFIPNPKHYDCVDHINRNRTDNRIRNLRWCNYQMNNNNRRLPSK